MQKKQYKTAGREALLSFLSSNPDRQFTAEEICIAVCGDHKAGKSSIYRRLGELCKAGEVTRVTRAGEHRASYRYIGAACDCGKHFHEKCTRCGAIRHLECDDSDAFVRHLLEVHGFAVDRGQSVLYGLCEACRNSERGCL